MKNNEIICSNLQGLLAEISDQTYRIFKSKITLDQLVEFDRILEDAVLFEIISCKSSKIVCSSIKGNVTENIKIALIASGISKDGKLPEGEEYSGRAHNVTLQDHYDAKKRVRELDIKREGGTYINKMNLSINNFQSNPQFFINIAELVEMGIAQNERNCGYIEERNDAVLFFEGATQAMWMTKRDLLEHYGYKNSLAYEICDSIYKRPYLKHYSLPTKTALVNMAEISFEIAKNGRQNFKDERLIKETLRNIEASKITDEEFIAPFEKRFKRIINQNELEQKEKKENKKILQLLPKKNK